MIAEPDQKTKYVLMEISLYRECSTGLVLAQSDCRLACLLGDPEQEARKEPRALLVVNKAARRGWHDWSALGGRLMRVFVIGCLIRIPPALTDAYGSSCGAPLGWRPRNDLVTTSSSRATRFVPCSPTHDNSTSLRHTHRGAILRGAKGPLRSRILCLVGSAPW